MMHRGLPLDATERQAQEKAWERAGMLAVPPEFLPNQLPLPGFFVGACCSMIWDDGKRWESHQRGAHRRKRKGTPKLGGFQGTPTATKFEREFLGCTVELVGQGEVFTVWAVAPGGGNLWLVNTAAQFKMANAKDIRRVLTRPGQGLGNSGESTA